MMDAIGDTVRTDRRWMHRLKDIDSLYLLPESPGATEYLPFVYVETRIDFNDVRTGYKSVVNLARALKIYSDHAALGWAEDMILDVDMRKVKEVPPPDAHLQPLPEFVDGSFIQGMETTYAEYVSKTWKVCIYRNPELNIYSGEGESREEFMSRCRELLGEPMREELNQLHILFNRKREQLKEKHLELVETEQTDEDALELGIPRPRISDKDIYSHYAERIDALFLNETLPASEPTVLIGKNSELEERLIPLEAEARKAIEELQESCAAKASLLDEYILHPSLKDIRCGRNCILWMPRQALPKALEAK
jgi:hypothetical protein